MLSNTKLFLCLPPVLTLHMLSPGERTRIRSAAVDFWQTARTCRTWPEVDHQWQLPATDRTARRRSERSLQWSAI